MHTRMHVYMRARMQPRSSHRPLHRFQGTVGLRTCPRTAVCTVSWAHFVIAPPPCSAAWVHLALAPGLAPVFAPPSAPPPGYIGLRTGSHTALRTASGYSWSSHRVSHRPLHCICFVSVAFGFAPGLTPMSANWVFAGCWNYSSNRIIPFQRYLPPGSGAEWGNYPDGREIVSGVRQRLVYPQRRRRCRSHGEFACRARRHDRQGRTAPRAHGVGHHTGRACLDRTCCRTQRPRSRTRAVPRQIDIGFALPHAHNSANPVHCPATSPVITYAGITAIVCPSAFKSASAPWFHRGPLGDQILRDNGSISFKLYCSGYLQALSNGFGRVRVAQRFFTGRLLTR